MNLLYIFSDGNCKGNGKKNARGGYSVYFGDILPFSQFNFTSLGGVTLIPTNNIMELSGIRYIFKILSENPEIFKDINVVIVTDSMYSIKCIDTWSKSWAKNGWKNSKRQEVKNKELIQEILDLKYQVNVKNQCITKFRHTFSHQQEPKDRSSVEWKLWNGNRIVDDNINKMLENF
jgi:ribonuclease HI